MRAAVCGCLLGFLAFTSSVSASGLQVSPVSLTLTERSGVLWLSSTPDQPVRAQVRVYRWSQSGGEDHLTISNDLQASPPFLDVSSSGRQLVRIVRRTVDDPAAPCEQTYRLGVDELPQPPRGAATTLETKYLLSYSVPVFLSYPPKFGH